jgi:16S rRNA (adenine1518-N6/adenine1519-N6)-dimethyltransferase
LSPRRLGQHFLTDPKILDRIVDALDPISGETVIEIGPGRGTLTAALLRRGLRVIAIEKDRELAAQLPRENLRVIEGDALEVQWPSAHKVVGNIPYYITSPLIDKALTPPLPDRVVFLMQAEVADRLAAKPGGKTYGALSVGVQAVAQVEKLFNIAPGAFRPPPTVRSTVVRLTPLAVPLVRPHEIAAFRTFVTACFSRRRKQLKNAVPGINEAELKALGLDPRVRPERLPPEAFVRLLGHQTRRAE